MIWIVATIVLAYLMVGAAVIAWTLSPAGTRIGDAMSDDFLKSTVVVMGVITWPIIGFVWVLVGVSQLRRRNA